MLSIGVIKGGSDVGLYYASDDYYSGDASEIEPEVEREAASPERIEGEGDDGVAVRRDGRRPHGGPGAEGGGPQTTREPGGDSEERIGPSASTRGKGQWYGRGAAALELRGSVDIAVLNAIVRGDLPNGVMFGTRPGKEGGREHSPGVDLTFSAPKSVSVLAEITGSRELFRAHNDAVREAVTWLEVEAAALRRKGWLGRKTEQTGNLVVALFQHDTSRAHDPQLHTHALVLNATRRDDGQWRSLHATPLFDHKMAAGNVYRAALAIALQKAGFEIEQTHADGRFEITAVPEAVAASFSKRRAEIEQKLESWGQGGAEASARAALMTRAHKRLVDLPVLRAAWDAEARAHGFDAGRVLHENLSRPRELPPVTEAEGLKVLREAVSRLSEREASFTHADLVGAVLAAGMGRLQVTQAEAIAAKATRTEGLDLYEARIGERRAWTTPKAAEQERRIEQEVRDGRNTSDAILPAKAVGKLLADGPLNSGQREAVKLIVSSPDQFVAVIGRPGTGKTTMVKTVKVILDGQGYRAVGMAPNGAAAKELEASGGLAGARTVASQLARLGKAVAELRGLDAEQREARLEGFRKEVWIVDEASQLNNRDTRRLVSFARITGARMALIGDPAQLEAIDAGRPFDRLVKAGIRHVEMTEILRQRSAPDRALVQSAIDRDIRAAIAMLNPNIHEIPAEGTREAEIVRRWWTSPNRDQTLMVSMRNEVKTRLNDMARDRLRAAGELGHEEAVRQLFPVFGQKADRQFAASYKAGDVLRFGNASKAHEIGKDSYWHVIAVQSKHSINRITIANGERVLTLDPREARNSLRSAEHFRPRETTLAENDRIVWNRPDPQRGLVNGVMLTVQSIRNGVVTARSAEGREVSFTPGTGHNERRDQHWEHYYATSLYKSQGKTAEYVLIDAPLKDGHLMNYHAFLVGVSRHRNSVEFFTDQKEALANRIVGNPGDKTSAQEGRAEEQTECLRRGLASVSAMFGGKREGAEGRAMRLDIAADRDAILSDREQLHPRIVELAQRHSRQPALEHPLIERGMGP